MTKPTDLMSRIDLPRIGNTDVKDTREEKHIEICGVELDNTELASGKYRFFGVNDAKLTKIIASNIVSDETSFVRVIMTNCYFTGFHMPEGYLQDIVFKSCKINLANFRGTKLKRVLFIGCDLAEADFAMAEFQEVEFEDCELTDVDFSNCKMKSVKFPGSSLASIRGITGIKSAIVTHTQLIEIAPLLANEFQIKLDT